MNDKNWRQSKICIVINDKSQDNTANHLSFDKLIYHSICGERIFKIGEHLAKLQAKWLIVSYAPVALDFCLQRRRTQRISKITCVMERNCY